MRPISLPLGPASLPDELPSLRRLATVRWLTLLAALMLSAIGLATIRSASAEMSIDYLPRQLVWVAVGLLVFFIVFAIDYQLLLNLAVPIYGLSLASLAVVLAFGHKAGGARSWLGFGGIGIQPSEFAKIATAILLARYLAGAGATHLRTRHILSAVAIVAAPMLLIAAEPDLGGAALFVPMLGGMLLVAGVRYPHPPRHRPRAERPRYRRLDVGNEALSTPEGRDFSQPWQRPSGRRLPDSAKQDRRRLR